MVALRATILHERMQMLRHSRKGRYALHSSGPYNISKVPKDVKDSELVCRSCGASNMASPPVRVLGDPTRPGA
jgi:hypothetical protein